MAKEPFDTPAADPEEIRKAVHAFLSLIDSDYVYPDRMAALRVALDRLAWAMRDLNPPFDERAGEPVDRRPRYDDVRDRVTVLFPELGLYPAVSPELPVGTAHPTAGDAVDDVADIALDLLEYVSALTSTSEADAIWRLSLSYRAHWGHHLRGLQLYLHARAFR